MTSGSAADGYSQEWCAALSDSTLARLLERAAQEMVTKRKEYEAATTRWSRLLMEHYQRRDATLEITITKEGT